jgi:hypothetical protein
MIGSDLTIRACGSRLSSDGLSRLLSSHYLMRRPSVSFGFELMRSGSVVGVCTFGVPASRHMQISACPSDPDLVLELNRLWIDDSEQRGTASWFLSRALRQIPPRIILSYADTSAGHDGIVYRAANFFYAGWTDMDRKTARFDYVFPGGHTRSAFRSGNGVSSERVRRRPKAKYWTISGGRGARRKIEKICEWERLDWKKYPVPHEHMQLLLHTEY